MPAAGARRGAEGSEPSANGGVAVDQSLWLLDPTWENTEALFHKLWGERRAANYSREEKNLFGALQSLMTCVRDAERERERQLRDDVARLHAHLGGNGA